MSDSRMSGAAQAAAKRYGLHDGYQDVQTQSQAVHSADQQVPMTGNWLADGFVTVRRWLEESAARTKFTDKRPAEVTSLREGLSIRPAPHFTPANYVAIPHTQLHSMVTQEVDPGTVGQVADTWLEIGDDLTSFQSHIASSLSTSETSWQGAAGDAARKSVASLGNKAAAAGQGAQLTGVVTHQQANALATAKNSMPPPPDPPFNPTTAAQHLQTITDPMAYAAQAANDQNQAATQKAAHRQAAHVVSEYDTTVAQTSAVMPSFAPPPSSAGHHAAPSGPGTTGGSGTGAGSGGGGGMARAGAPRTAPRPTSDGRTSPGSPGMPGGPGAPFGPPTRLPAGTPVATSTSGFVGPGELGGGSNFSAGGDPFAGGAGGAGGANPSAGSSTGDLGGTMFGPFGGVPGGGDDLPRSGSLGAAGRGFGAAGGPGSGSGSGADGSGGPGGSRGAGGLDGSGGMGGRAGAGATGRSGLGAGGESGAESGAAAAEEAAIGRGTAGARGGSGMGTMPPGGRRKEEDAEHQRPSFLVEQDPESIFGTDQRTAPPVIGG